MMNRLTRQKAIEAKCKDCMYDSEVKGTWRAQVQACTETTCHLHPYRPVTRAVRDARAAARSQASSATAVVQGPDLKISPQMCPQGCKKREGQHFTRQQAINAYCKWCIYHESNGGTWRAQIEACTTEDCALFEFRSLTKASEKARAAARSGATPVDPVGQVKNSQPSLQTHSHSCKKRQSDPDGGAA